jgi:hypothetical protein
VNAQEIKAAIEVLASATRTKAEDARRQAAEAVEQAASYSNKHVGAAMAATRTRLRNDAAAKAEALELEAARHDLRAAAASAGYVLVTEADAKSPSFMRDNQELIAQAARFGLVRDTPPAY